MHTNTLLLCIFLLFRVIVAGNRDNSGDSINPFTPKGYLIRYWKKQISNELPKPWFLLNNASPLNAAQYATYSKLAGNQESLSKEIQSFCTYANLLCFPDISSSLEKHDQDVQFSSYMSKNFTNYGTKLPRGFDSFKKYAENDNLPVNSFRQYSRGGAGHNDKFSTYAPNGNVIDQSFNTYGTGAAGGVGEFKNYAPNVNVPNLRFTTYSTEGVGRKQSFTSYTKDTNSGGQSFTSYAKNSNGAVNDFTIYANNSNVIGSTFTNYGESENGGGNTFKSYGSNANIPENNFKNYGVLGNAPFENFISYRDKSNVGDDNFVSYVDDPNSGKANFQNYGQSLGEGSDSFSKYGSGITDVQTIGFKTYGVNTTFKEYGKSIATFADYKNKTINGLSSSLVTTSGKNVNNKWVEPGKFFREKMLTTGTIMPMPDIQDKMPKRSFLPRVIASKLPFSTSKINELKKIFHAGDDSQMGKMIADALTECERSPSVGETKRCVNSIEDMIDFSTSVLGRNIVVRTTQNTKGSKGDIMIGSVKGINGGKVTKSVSCHQSLFPYLVYYCHSVPKVRVYEADILDPNSKAKINYGVAICHVNTSAWGASHGAFITLGSGPGKIEVCHWIFENDMTWTVVD
ncbi:hypothetical protein K7X08_006377 [Anisodus acutangulus]|uniref:BURP domain-containing protein n=1 Tax=Anisodus acutangulus TaxID=402998 RepID=A0A9Q1MVX6_9SOLA|nr:hypothetical protein K7X08_006377 [Anisodus acutangulus]